MNSDFDWVIIEGSKLRMKTDYDCGTKPSKKLNTLLTNNVILTARLMQNRILISSPILAHRQKLKTKSDFVGWK